MQQVLHTQSTFNYHGPGSCAREAPQGVAKTINSNNVFRWTPTEVENWKNQN